MNKTVTRRTLLNGFLALALVPCLAQAQRTIPVEVVNGSTAPIPVVTQNSAVSSPLQRRLVGLTAQVISPDGGLITLNETCEAEFPGSRICTSKEITSSLSVPSPNGLGHWWILRTLTTLVVGSQILEYDTVSGSRAPVPGGGLNCAGWKSSSSNLVGLATDAEGKIDTIGCQSDTVGVACCASTQ